MRVGGFLSLAATGSRVNARATSPVIAIIPGLRIGAKDVLTVPLVTMMPMGVSVTSNVPIVRTRRVSCAQGASAT